jgi:thiol:disulfide interchange protein DsbD
MAIPRNLFVLIFFLFSACINSESIGYASNSNVEIISGDEKLEPNKEYLIGIKYRLDSGWHTYWKNPGDSGEKASFDWTLPEGYQIKGPYWPQPERIPYPPLMTFGYNDQVTVFFNLVTSETLKENNEVSLFTKWLACADVCLPQEANITINLSNNKSSSYSSVEIEDLFDRTIPKVFDKNISATYLKDKLILSFDLPEIHKTDSIVFFPNEYGLIDYSKDQIIERNDNSASISLTKIDLDKDFINVSGLLKFIGESSSSSYKIKTSLPQKSSYLSLSPLIAIIFAFFGGLILNLMPCVFPVISLKILNFLEISDSPKEVKKHGLVFSAGTLITFLVIGMVILLIRSNGEQIGWGFQLQSPIFVSALIYLFIFMSGLFYSSFAFGSAFTRLGNLISSSNGYSGSFGTGFLAVLVATPCTAPFMGSAIGFALIQPSIYSFLIFLSLGLGFCFPYLLLSFNPGLLKFLPGPGQWMESFKKFMAIPMALTALWLIWVLSNQITEAELLRVIMGISIILVLILLNNSKNIISVNNKYNYPLIIISLLSLIYLTPKNNDYLIDDQLFSTNELYEKINEGPVFLNFTADWCITCKVNEKVALDNKVFKDFITSKNISYIKADWTNRNDEISSLLESFGRSGIPLYVFYPSKDRQPIILPEVLTEKIVIKYLSEEY